jgi:cupin fold WbuC family metalloprotein
LLDGRLFCHSYSTIGIKFAIIKPFGDEVVMLHLKMLSTEAYQAEAPIISLGGEEFNFLAGAINKSERKRSRICAHKNTEAELHEMFVIYGKETYVRPNKHFGKDESVFVIEGSCDVCFFDDVGNITNKILLGDSRSGRPYYCRIPREIFHSVIIHSEKLVLFESTSGPFNPHDTFYADWSPLEGDYQGIQNFRKAVGRQQYDNCEVEVGDNSYVKLNDNVYQETNKISYVSSKHHSFLNRKMNDKFLDRVRICNHSSPTDHLHEMLMLFSNRTFVTPSLHIDREESLFVLEGEGRYVFFDEDGNITNVVALSGVDKAHNSYCRVPENTFHMLIVDSPRILVKETTTGPFSKNSTIFPEWVPSLNDLAKQQEFIAGVEARLRMG